MYHLGRSAPQDLGGRRAIIAAFAALAGRDQNWIADQIGHTTPHFTFSVYEQVHRRRYVDEQAIWELMRFAGEPADRGSLRQATRLIT